jgi:hypothetical protein
MQQWTKLCDDLGCSSWACTRLTALGASCFLAHIVSSGWEVDGLETVLYPDSVQILWRRSCEVLFCGLTI